MARVSAEEFREKLEKGKALPAILLLGDEVYLRDSCRAALIEKFVPEAARAWAVSRFSADRGEAQALSCKGGAGNEPVLAASREAHHAAARGRD